MRSGLGEQPNITGFTFDAQGQLTPIPSSTRPLSGLPDSGCTQVAFVRTGNVVIVEEQQPDVLGGRCCLAKNRPATQASVMVRAGSEPGPPSAARRAA